MRYVPAVDDRERARLVETNLDLAHKAANLIHPRVRKHVGYEELLSLANAGLAEAAARFDPARGASFSTYAWYRVYGSVIDGIRRAVNLPRSDWARLVALRGAAQYLEQRSQREDGAKQAGAAQQTPAEALAALRDAMAAIKTIYVTSLEAIAETEGFAPAEPAPEMAARIDSQRMGRRLRKAIGALPEKERELLKKHYFEGKDLDEAGGELGISKSWASRLHARAVERLRDAVAEEDTA